MRLAVPRRVFTLSQLKYVADRVKWLSDLLNPPAGCPFAPRCKNCMKICLSKMPPRTELSDTHYTYCWLQQKAAFEKGEKAE